MGSGASAAPLPIEYLQMTGPSSESDSERTCSAANHQGLASSKPRIAQAEPSSAVVSTAVTATRIRRRRLHGLKQTDGATPLLMMKTRDEVTHGLLGGACKHTSPHSASEP